MESIDNTRKCGLCGKLPIPAFPYCYQCFSDLKNVAIWDHDDAERRGDTLTVSDLIR